MVKSVKTAAMAEPQSLLRQQQGGDESLESPSGLWSTELMAAFQLLLQSQTEMGATSFRDGLTHLWPQRALNRAIDKMLESVSQYPARMEQATGALCSSFDLLAQAQVDWFSRACDNWAEISRSASASVFRSAASEAAPDRRIAAEVISFPDRRSASTTFGTSQALRRAN